MNTRLLYLILFVQALFALGLIMVGFRAREKRRDDYLELTWRVSSGQASADDFAQLKSHLAPNSDAQTVRSLFGVPMQMATEIAVGEKTPETRKGTFWLYYPLQAGGPVTPESAKKLSGPVQAFVVSFDDKDHASGEMLSVQHLLK